MARFNSVSIFVIAAEMQFDGTELCTQDFSEPAELHIIFCGFTGPESEYFQQSAKVTAVLTYLRL